MEGSSDSPIFGYKGTFFVSYCCMCPVVKWLVCSLGINLVVFVLDAEEEGLSRDIHKTLAYMMGGGIGRGEEKVSAPVLPVFVKGKLLGDLDCLMAMHIGRNLVPSLKEAGALATFVVLAVLLQKRADLLFQLATTLKTVPQLQGQYKVYTIVLVIRQAC
ncbi:hypothetical protein SUGI_0678630 [Cryptomeria japonica]|nr:hypothetical protein SUGI_0678630 [Cryptomeria japonica]